MSFSCVPEPIVIQLPTLWRVYRLKIKPNFEYVGFCCGWVEVLKHFKISTRLTPFCPGGTGSSIAWGGQFDPHFEQLPWAYWAIILSILIIILFKERINDYLEKNWVNILKIGRDIAIFFSQEIFWEILRI